MHWHDRSEKGREVFSLLSEYLNPELPPTLAMRWKPTWPTARLASNLPRVFSGSWNFAAATRQARTSDLRPYLARLIDYCRQAWFFAERTISL